MLSRLHLFKKFKNSIRSPIFKRVNKRGNRHNYRGYSDKSTNEESTNILDAKIYLGCSLFNAMIGGFMTVDNNYYDQDFMFTLFSLMVIAGYYGAFIWVCYGVYSVSYNMTLMFKK